jgi:hypothetical protein
LAADETVISEGTKFSDDLGADSLDVLEDSLSFEEEWYRDSRLRNGETRDRWQRNGLHQDLGRVAVLPLRRA